MVNDTAYAEYVNGLQNYWCDSAFAAVEVGVEGGVEEIEEIIEGVAEKRTTAQSPYER